MNERRKCAVISGNSRLGEEDPGVVTADDEGLSPTTAAFWLPLDLINNPTDNILVLMSLLVFNSKGEFEFLSSIKGDVTSVELDKSTISSVV